MRTALANDDAGQRRYWYTRLVLALSLAMP